MYMITKDSELDLGSKFPNVKVKQDNFGEYREIDIRICKGHDDSPFQLTMQRYGETMKKPFISIGLSEESTVQLFHAIGTALNLHR